MDAARGAEGQRTRRDERAPSNPVIPAVCILSDGGFA